MPVWDAPATTWRQAYGVPTRYTFVYIHGRIPFSYRQKPCILLCKSNGIFFETQKGDISISRINLKKLCVNIKCFLYTSWIWWHFVIVFWFSDCITWGKFEKCAAKLTSRSRNEIKYRCLSQLIRYCTEISDYDIVMGHATMGQRHPLNLDEVKDAHRSGRPAISTPREDHILRILAVRNRQASSMRFQRLCHQGISCNSPQTA